jgi:hypothetical protein
MSLPGDAVAQNADPFPGSITYIEDHPEEPP